MDRHTFRVLEFDRICEFLKCFAASEGAKRRCDMLVPATALTDVHSLLDQTTELRREIENNGPLTLSGLYDVRPCLRRARVHNACLEPAELVQTHDTLETAATLKAYFSGLSETCPALQAVTLSIQPLAAVTGPIGRSIGRQGDILDGASPALTDVRQRLKKLRFKILSILQSQFADTDISRAFQDDFITLRNNRYVIPVRSDSKSLIPGVVHDQSQSGATFFVEPLSVVSINNDLQVLHKEEYYEEIRILTELTRVVHEHAGVILNNLEHAEEIDLIHARALLSRALQATAPQVTIAGALRLAACRHPILMARFVPDESAPEAGGPGQMLPPKIPGAWAFDRPGITPIDIVKEPDVSTLIITGANAGGKTVALKTYGLFVLMAQSGMHLPVDAGAMVPLQDSVYADIGDEQNIEASLSTFSAHMALIKTIVTSAGPASLVLLDELGSGTDPIEGGALAGAILDYLHTTGCTTVVTTHLTFLKTYAYRRTCARNVSVEFDPDTLRPLFRLVYGVPGISNALAIARHIGIPDEILATAGMQLETSDKHITELIVGLERSQQALTIRKQHLESALQSAHRHQQLLEALVAAVTSRKEKLVQKFEADARTLLRQSEITITDIIRQLKRSRLIRPGDAADPPEAVRTRFDAVKKSLQEKFPRRTAAHTPVQNLTTGQSVTVLPLGKTGTVISADNQARRAEVDLGHMRVKTRFDDMELAKAQSSRPHRQAAPATLSDPAPADIPEKRINIIGMRAADALPVVDKAIDESLLQGAQRLEIIHGRGTGRLMQAIHEHLKDNPLIAGFGIADPSQGGSGITVVHMK
jgi:DNA mismatch repair protein MutS2